MRKAQFRALFAGVLIAGVSAATLFATHRWGNYHWARTTPQFTLKIGDNMTSADWKSHLARASSDWNSPPSSTTTPLLTSVVTGSANKRCSRMVAGTTQVCNATYGFNGWLGLATISILPDDHITQGSAKMNDSYFNTATYNNPNERQHVVCQEIAHTFGLAHQSEDGSSLDTCMDYFSNTGANAGSTLSTKPNAHDFEELNIIYAHLDSTTTVAAMTSPAGSASEVSEDPNSWGQLVSQSKNGRSSTYERFERDGSTTATHVFWTLEAAANCPSCDHRFDR
jgi:hypothetical protein